MALPTYYISWVTCLADWLARGQNRLRGPAEDLVLSQAGRSPLKIRTLGHRLIVPQPDAD